MKIGIDLDDTVFLTVKSMLKYADKFEEEIEGIPTSRDSFGMIKNRYYLEALYGWDNETKAKFFDTYYKNVLEECTLLPNANIVINKLKDDGNTIHFVTARLMNIENCDTKNITIDSFNKFNIKYDTLNLHINNKLQFFKDNNFDLCIEDSYETCKEMEENGIKAILMTTKMNQNIVDDNIIRVENWNQIYDIISK